MLLKKYISIFLFILGMLPIYSGAQSLRNFRSRSITNTTDTITLDSLSIVPGSLIIKDSLGNQLNSEDYSVNYAESKMILKKKVPSLLVTYNVFPINFSTPYFHKDIKLIEPDDKGTYNPFAFTFEKQTVDIFKFDGLNKNGSISRGVSFGNSQDVVINSSFNLQLSGKLNNEIDILAAITDNNIPIQPDGNTQQIQDFDKVYIQLSANNSKLIAGDFELTKPESYFMNFNKKAQGGSFTTSFLTADKKKKTDKIAIKTAAAISKGKYAKNTIPGIEGNQGPYKLTGAENETYIIVLSGTEKVFISGELMVRGQENDYVIDYNTAEITFTAKRLITKDSRISIEFEYSDKNYARSLFYTGVDYSGNKITTNLHFFTEQDLKNQAIQQELSDAEKTMLSQIGDSLSLAMVPYVDSIAYTNDQVLYKIKDTLVSGILYDSVYVYSTNPDSAHYRLGFSNVGANKGNYIQIQSSANGRVFQWVAPILGVKQGNYEPIIQLVTPKKKQLLTFSTAYAISKRTKTSVELALSNQDLNLFSSVGNSDNIGYAWKAQLSHIIPLTKKDSLGWSFITDISHEYANKQFNPIERYRSVEFERDWNLSTLLTNLTENSSTIKLSVSDKKKNYTSFQLKSFLAGAQYKGLQNLLNGNLEKNTVKLVFSGSLLSSDNTINNSRFIRSKADLSKRFKKLIIGIKEEQEYNTFHKNNTDTLQLNSYSFQEMEGYISNADTTKNKFKLFYSKRMDYLPTNDELDLSTTAHNTGISLELAKNKNHTFTVYQTYRNLIINNTSLTTQKEDKSLISRLEYVLKAYKGALSSNTYYEIGSGQEVKKEYSYLEVVQGQGIYSWTDYNADGVKQLNEFEIAAFQDQANYIRVYIPTNQYIKTYTNLFSESLLLNPVVVWNTATGWKKFLSRFSNQTIYRVDHKNTDPDLYKAYNPFVNEINDTTFVSLTSSFRNSLYFNRSSSVFGFDLTYQDNRNKTLLVNGFDSRTNIIKSANLKWNISRKISLTTSIKTGEKTNKSDYFNTKNYIIIYSETEPIISYQPNTSFRISVNYKYTEKRNNEGLINEKAFINKTGIDIKYNVLSKGSLLTKINFVNIKYNSTDQSSVAYEMLEGLKTGNNATWSLSYQKNLSGNLQLTLNYEGRKSKEISPVHVGSVQLRAYF